MCRIINFQQLWRCATISRQGEERTPVKHKHNRRRRRGIGLFSKHWRWLFTFCHLVSLDWIPRTRTEIYSHTLPSRVPPSRPQALQHARVTFGRSPSHMRHIQFPAEEGICFFINVTKRISFLWYANMDDKHVRLNFNHMQIGLDLPELERREADSSPLRCGNWW